MGKHSTETPDVIFSETNRFIIIRHMLFENRKKCNFGSLIFTHHGNIQFFQKVDFLGVSPRKLSLSKIGVMDMS